MEGIKDCKRWQVQGVSLSNRAPLNWGNISSRESQDILIPSSSRGISQWFDNTGFVALRTATGTVQLSGNPVWVSFTAHQERLQCDLYGNAAVESGASTGTAPSSLLTTCVHSRCGSRTCACGRPTTSTCRSSRIRRSGVDERTVPGRVHKCLQSPVALRRRRRFRDGGVITNPTNADFGKIATSIRGTMHVEFSSALSSYSRQSHFAYNQDRPHERAPMPS
jgi:hypothetical protein